MQRRSALLRQIAKIDALLIDDFGLAILTDQLKRDLLEVLEDRYDKKSTIITSQLPVEEWHGYLNHPTLADAILDRLVHNAYRLTLTGESMRKKKISPRPEQKSARDLTLPIRHSCAVPPHGPTCREILAAMGVKPWLGIRELRK